MNIEEKKRKVLDALNILSEGNIWELANPLSIFIKNLKEINIELLDNLLNIISKNIIETKDEIKILKINKAKNILIELLEEERKEKEIELNEAEKLIENII